MSENLIGNLKRSVPISTQKATQSYDCHQSNLDSIDIHKSVLNSYRTRNQLQAQNGYASRSYGFNSANLNPFSISGGFLTYFKPHTPSRNGIMPNSFTSSVSVGRNSYFKYSEHNSPTMPEIFDRSAYKSDRRNIKKLPILSSVRPLGLNFPTPKRMASFIGNRKICNSQERPLLMGYQTDFDDFEQGAAFEIIPNKNGLKISPVSAPSSQSAHSSQASYDKYSHARYKFHSQSRPLLFLRN